MSKRTNKAEIEEFLRLQRPRSKQLLKDYVKVFLRVTVPDQVLTDGHSSPMDYIWHSFNADFASKKGANADCVVWSNRGGSKTLTAAVATILDCIFKPNVQIRILSGSGYQAGRMYEYFEKFVHLGFEDLVKEIKNWPTRKTVFKNGAMVEVLVPSESSVRGQHVHKLRCDEVELFRPRIFEAAQYTTMSSNGCVAALELISTKHLVNGLMAKFIAQAKSKGHPIFKWNIWDVVEKCERECLRCILEDCCKGRAKEGRGYYKIDDVVTQLGRTRASSFNMEMLCDEGSKKKYGWRFRERLY